LQKREKRIKQSYRSIRQGIISEKTLTMKIIRGGNRFSRVRNCSRALIVAGFLFGFLADVRHAAGQTAPSDQSPLDSWSFYDTTGWTSDYGYLPVSFTNITASIYGDDGALVLDSTNAAWLRYNVIEGDGTTNLTVNMGSVTLWFAPSWSSTNAGGIGSGSWGELIDAGQWTSNATYGWWSLYTDPAGTNLYFSAQNNAGSQVDYLSAPVAWTAGQWHFVALTYSSTNTALYLDGKLATNGAGMTIWPSSTVLANGFYVGSDTNGESQAHGSFDDIYTYNFVLDSNTISSTFSAFNPSYYLLDSWSFNKLSWVSDFGYYPVSFTNLNTTVGDEFALLLDTNVPAWLQYNVYESDGRTNLTVNKGSVTMWFAPDWASTNAGGVGPGEWGQLIDAGEWTSDASYGWWSLNVDPSGTNLWFSAQGNDGSQTNYLSVPISWTVEGWHFIALTYSATNTALYLDGKLATNGVGMTIWPSSTVLSHGFYIGSDTNGETQAHGIFDDIATYSIPLDANTVSNLFLDEEGPYQIDPYTTFGDSVTSAPSEPSPTVYEAITGIGSLQIIGSASSCVSSTKVWITNVIATISGSGTNATMNLMFAIEGGSNGVPYDVFANSVLGFGTNSVPWAWMGQGNQCNVYKLTNLPPTACFLILGTPQDSDGDGLTDAYELLVSHTNPNNPDTDGDGLSDAWEVLLGLNPNANDNATSASRSNYSYDLADWLEGLSGIRTGSVSLDNEGNVLSVSQ
jgi:Concanavalin A-like lectin/glucanases superfamily/Bacterial TSP3 repeat